MLSKAGGQGAWCYCRYRFFVTFLAGGAHKPLFTVAKIGQMPNFCNSEEKGCERCRREDATDKPGCENDGSKTRSKEIRGSS
jgi:hypothetical protein